MKRGLTPSELAYVRAAMAKTSGRARIAEEIAIDAVEAREAWTGRRIARGVLVTVDLPPARVVPVLEIRYTIYRERKGHDYVANHVHEHRAPYPLLARAAIGAERSRSSRDATKPTGADLFRMGRLVAFAGRKLATLPSSPRYRMGRGETGLESYPGTFDKVAFRSTAPGVTLAGDPRTRRMLVLGAPLYVLSNGSHYRVEDRGIVG